jgi:AcrR family transcriptional regulator
LEAVMSGQPPKTTDRRVQRTRRTLREALIALILERGWDAASVQEVCARADVGRSTFYTHFADLEDLLTGGLDDLKVALRHQLAPASPADPFPFAHGLIAHAHEQRRLFSVLIGKRSGQLVLRRFRDLVLDLVREDLTALAPAGPSRDAAAHFVAGGFLELLAWWLDARAPLAPDELERLFLEMARPVLDPHDPESSVFPAPRDAPAACRPPRREVRRRTVDGVAPLPGTSAPVQAQPPLHPARGGPRR